MTQVTNEVGNLVMVRAEKLEPSLVMTITRVVRALGERAVVVVDLRKLRVLSPEQAAMIQGSHLPKVTREAVLVGASAIQRMQASRIVSAQPHAEIRRVFDDAEAVLRWIAEVATLRETARLRSFLAEG